MSHVLLRLQARPPPQLSRYTPCRNAGAEFGAEPVTVAFGADGGSHVITVSIDYGGLVLTHTHTRAHTH